MLHRFFREALRWFIDSNSAIIVFEAQMFHKIKNENNGIHNYTAENTRLPSIRRECLPSLNINKRRAISQK